MDRDQGAAALVLGLQLLALAALAKIFATLLLFHDERLWIAKYGDNVWLLLSFGLAAGIFLFRGASAYAAIFATIGASYAREPLKCLGLGEDYFPIQSLLGLAFWLLALTQPTRLEGWRRALGLLLAGACLSLALAAFAGLLNGTYWYAVSLLSAPAVVVVTYRSRRAGFRMWRSVVLTVGLAIAPITLFVVLESAFQMAGSPLWPPGCAPVLLVVPVNCWLSIAPLGILRAELVSRFLSG